MTLDDMIIIIGLLMMILFLVMGIHYFSEVVSIRIWKRNLIIILISSVVMQIVGSLGLAIFREYCVFTFAELSIKRILVTTIIIFLLSIIISFVIIKIKRKSVGIVKIKRLRRKRKRNSGKIIEFPTKKQKFK